MVTSTFLNKIFEFSFYKKEISNDVKYLINEIKDIEYEQINSDKSITLNINNVDFSDVKRLSIEIKNRLILLYEILNKNGMKIVVNVNEK